MLQSNRIIATDVDDILRAGVHNDMAKMTSDMHTALSQHRLTTPGIATTRKRCPSNSSQQSQTNGDE